METVKIMVEGKILTGTVTGRSESKSHRASERGIKLFVLVDGVEYQCWWEGAQPYQGHKSAIQPLMSRQPTRRLG